MNEKICRYKILLRKKFSKKNKRNKNISIRDVKQVIIKCLNIFRKKLLSKSKKGISKIKLCCNNDTYQKLPKHPQKYILPHGSANIAHQLSEAITGEYVVPQHPLNNKYRPLTFCAKPLLTIWQQIFILCTIASLAYGLSVNHELTMMSFILIGNTILLLLLIIKSLLLKNSLYLIKNNLGFNKGFIAKRDDIFFPYYSILVPLYKEADIIDNIINNIKKIDYPVDKLQALLIVEEDDFELRTKLSTMNLPKCFFVIIIPYGIPKTKARACNFAMKYVYGEFLTIFDAEDKPQTDQLKKAVNVFLNNPDIFCLQSRLSYYNRDENWITKMFDIEYRVLFLYLLPSLRRIGSFIPLGGSSNHFRTHILRNIGGWDDYNVTEDAELGLRITMEKLRTEMLDSNTEEEAPLTIQAWLKQRCRWIKGHIMTYIVYMRNPINTFSTLKFSSFITFSYMMGIAQMGLILSPLLFTFTILTTLDVITFEHLSPIVIFLSKIITFINIISGVAISFANAWIAIDEKTKIRKILLSCNFCCYSLLHSIAAFLAIFQIITKPYHWNKTAHGISKYFKNHDD